MRNEDDELDVGGEQIVRGTGGTSETGETRERF